MKIYLFYCSASLDIDQVDTAFQQKMNGTLKMISLPCSGKVDLLYLVKAVETGADGIILVTCKKGECRFLEGNLRARRRAEELDSFLEEIGLGRGRVTVLQMTDGGMCKILEEIEAFYDRIGSHPAASPRTAAS